MTSPLDSALSYAARGWLVFPLWWVTEGGACACGDPSCSNPGKHPLGKLAHAGRNSAAKDEKKILSWWKKYPAANVGIATGKNSGLLVIDIDPRHGGDKNLKKLPGNFPMTTKAKTGGGGEHYYFKYPEGSDITIGARLGGLEGIDWRGEGGYVVAPPSNHPSGGVYLWDVRPESTAWPLAAAPGWLLELFQAPPPAPASTSVSSTVQLSSEDLLPPEEQWATDLLKGGVTEGARDETCARLAGRYLGHGLSEEEVTDLLLLWNRQKNSPPLPDKDVRKVVKSIAKKESRKRVAQSVPEAGGEKEEEIPPGLPEDEKRAVLIESIGKRLGIDLLSISRMAGDQVKYIFRVANPDNGDQPKEIWMAVPDLTSWNNFKNKIAALCKRMIPMMKSGPWGLLVQRMMDAAEDIEPGPDATMGGVLYNLLETYLENHVPYPEFSDSQEPFILNERTNIFLTKFAFYLKIVHGLNLSTQDLAQRLKVLGAEQKTVWLQGKTRRFWELPGSFTNKSVNNENKNVKNGQKNGQIDSYQVH